jgi:hypothetical protein
MYADKGVERIEFWVNIDTGTYTYVFIHTNGLACMGDGGKDANFGPSDNTVTEIPEGDPT